MKNLKNKTIATALFAMLGVAAMNLSAQDQKSEPPAGQNHPTPEQVAARQAVRLQKTLGLSEEQTKKIEGAALARANATKKAHDKYGPQGDRKAMRDELKPVREQFVQTVSGILTPEQKTKWDTLRMQAKQRMMQRHGGAPGQQQGGGGNGQIQKLLPDDDGFDE